MQIRISEKKENHGYESKADEGSNSVLLMANWSKLETTLNISRYLKKTPNWRFMNL